MASAMCTAKAAQMHMYQNVNVKYDNLNFPFASSVDSSSITNSIIIDFSVKF